MNKDALIRHLHRADLSQKLKLLTVLSTFQSPVAMAEILDRAEVAGLKRRKWSNPSASLSRAEGLAIHSSQGWEITAAGRTHLVEQGIDTSTSGDVRFATGLRAFLKDVTDENIRTFVDEAVRCYEQGLRRSAIVMAWLAAVHVLQHWVFQNHLAAFNHELARTGHKPSKVISMEDFERIKESVFLDRISSISLIGKTRKAALQRCLDLRNNCGHPNSFKVSNHSVAAHIEVLLENVFLDREISRM